MAISALFDISIDDLLSNERGSKKVVETEYLYESITEYDIDESKHYDMKLEGRSGLYWRDMRARKSGSDWGPIHFQLFRMISRLRLMISGNELI